MALPETLQEILRTIAREVIGDTLTSGKDYGTFPHIDYLDYGLHDDEVLLFLAECTRVLTSDRAVDWTVVSFDGKHCATGIPSGMHVAFVPRGESWMSPQAKCVHLSAGSNGVALIRPNAEVASQIERQQEEREALQQREFKANGLIERLQDELFVRTHRRVLVWLAPYNTRQLTPTQRAELAVVLGLTEPELDNAAAVGRVLDARHDLNFLCQILIAIGKEDLALL